MRFHKILPACLALCASLGGTPALAALPDAVRFGVTIEAGDIVAAKRWLDQGLDPDFLADRVGTGLMLGAWEGSIPMMELFLQRGASINAVNRQGEQALQLAAWKGHLPAVAWLLDHGAAINRNGAEWSALHYATFAGHNDIVELLIRKGGDTNARAPNGSTVLMMAVREGREDLIQPLLAAGADRMARNDRGDSALTWAMRYGHFSIAERIATRAEFAAAARAPLQSWGSTTRSVAAPNDISELMRRIRVLEASGQNAASLRKTLRTEIEAFKQGSRRETITDRTLPPRALVITAKRSKPGEEKAELVAAAPATGANPPPAAPPRSRVADILYQLRLAEAEGRPTQALRQELIEAVGAMQR